MTKAECDTLCKALHALQQKNMGERMKNAKRKGAKREHRSIALLEVAGYRCTRAAASLGA
ncbi:MAG TPA: hypothetical protein VGX03_22145 [Candidatus Binatia bacterium]|nr:hypothetical protein [Candidatus Binatia bacterium]